MTPFEVARLPRTELIIRYQAAHPLISGSRHQLESVSAMSNDQLAAGILGPPKTRRSAQSLRKRVQDRTPGFNAT